MSKFGKAAEEMNTINSDGKAFNGNYGAAAIAFGIIGIAIAIGLFSVGSGIVQSALAAIK